MSQSGQKREEEEEGRHFNRLKQGERGEIIHKAGVGAALLAEWQLEGTWLHS